MTGPPSFPPLSAALREVTMAGNPLVASPGTALKEGNQGRQTLWSPRPVLLL